MAVGLVMAAGMLGGLVPAEAQSTSESPQRTKTGPSLADRLNANTVSVISGNPNGTYLYMAYDLSAVLDNGDNLRILPVIGKGGYGNARDVLHLKGIDLGLSRTDILKHLIETGELGDNIEDKLVYITKLYNEEMHILAGAGIEKLEDLNGKKVNFSDVNSGSQFSTRRLFKALGINATEVNMGQAAGYLAVKSGEIAATVLVAGKPTGSFKNFEMFKGAKLLPVPYVRALQETYFPAQLTHDDYPNLLKEGETVDTVAVGAVLISFNWGKDSDRYRRVAKFVDAFFSKLAQLKRPPRHPKWRETNLAVNLKGLKRFPRAQELLDEITKARAAAQKSASYSRLGAGSVIDEDLARAQAAREAPNDPLAQERLFNQFMDWVRKQDN